MILRLDPSTLVVTLELARRLIDRGSAPEGLFLTRELLAGLIEPDQIARLIQAWTRPESQRRASGTVLRMSRLPEITKAFASAGYTAEAARLVATGAGLWLPRLGELVEAGQGSPSGGSASDVTAAASDLAELGLDLLNSGQPEGITLMGVAHRAAPQVPLPYAEIAAGLGRLPIREAVRLDPLEAQDLTQAVYDLRFSGRRESAARVGALVPSVMTEPVADQWLDRLEAAAKPEAEPAFLASREILSKGYPAEAANLLVDSGAVSVDDIWSNLDKGIVGPSEELSTPSRFGFYVRSLRNLAEPSDALARSIEMRSADAVESVQGDRSGGGDGGDYGNGGGPPPAESGAASAEAKEPAFFFLLEGEGARCDEVVWGANFDLSFHYGVLREHALATVEGRKLDGLLDKAEATLDIDIIPRGGLKLADGLMSRPAVFRNGSLVEPPVFHLKAPQKDQGAREEPGVHVLFWTGEARVYDFFLPISLVDKLSDNPCGALPPIDLDRKAISSAAAEGSQPHRLTITGEGDVWRFGGVINGIDVPQKLTNNLSGPKLDAEYQKILGDLAKIAAEPIWKNIDGQLQVSDADEAVARVCMERAMAAGSKLYRRLAEDEVFKTALDLIDKLPDGSRITIVTDNTVFPWELLYPPAYNNGYPPENYKPECFWGWRFQIESLLVTTTEAEKIPLPCQQAGKLHVSMGLNGEIDSESEWKDRPLLPVKLQKEYYKTALRNRGTLYDSYDDILTIFRTDHPASMIYFFCHGSGEQLKFATAKPMLTPDDVMGPSYSEWPIVFLNACSAADISPLSFFSFRKRFRKKKAAGLIAPSFPIPTLFAAVFAKTVITRYTDEARPMIGSILFDLRRELLDRNNPLGLWYSVQCPLDVQAPRL